MSTISPLEQIQNFTQLIRQIPPNDFERLAFAQEIFAQLSQIPDPTCQKALGEAKVLLELKGEQAVIALQIVNVTERLLQVKQAIPQASGANYASLKEELRQLHLDVDSLPDGSFETEETKEKMIEHLKLMDAELESKNPTAWKVDAFARTLIAGGIGSIYALNPHWIQSQSWLATQVAPLIQNYGAAAHWGVGLGIGLAGMGVAYGVEKFFRSIPHLIASLATSNPPQQERAIEQPQQKIPSMETFGPAHLLPHEIPVKWMHPAKQFAYNKLTGGQAPQDPLLFSKHRLLSIPEVLHIKPFELAKQAVVEKEGVFTYPPSTEAAVHWTADFADPHLFGYVHSPLLAQEELLALEHPALYHLDAALDQIPQLQALHGDEVALILNVRRYGALSGLYGNAFASAPHSKIDACLQKFDEPQFSNLFAIAAPRAAQKPGAPYEIDDLHALFIRAYTAFTAIKSLNKQTTVAHTGNWGAGAFGGSPLAAALCQLLAARAAGVELHYYPLEQKEALSKARSILHAIETQQPQARIGDIISYLAKQSKQLGIVYGRSNGT